MMTAMHIDRRAFLAALLAAGTAGRGALAAAQRLVIYTYDSFTAEWGAGPKIEKAHEGACGCDARFIGLADGVSILNRLKLEGARTRADVVLGLDTNLLVEAKATGLLAEHGIDLAPLKLPVKWHDEVFVPYDWGHFAVVYDREKLRQVPKSLKELVEGPEEEKIILQDPRTSTPGLGFLLWMKAVFGDQAAAAWRRLKRRILTITPGWSQAYGLFTKGEAPMVLSYATSPAYHMIVENTERYQAALFAEGHYLQIELMARTKAARAPALAQGFLRFALTPGFQDHIPTGNWMMPAAATSRPLPEAFAKLIQPSRSLLLPPEEVARRRREWIAEWREVMAG